MEQTLRRIVTSIHFATRRNRHMALTPIPSVTLAAGASQNVTVVDQNGVALPDSSIGWIGLTGIVTIVSDAVLGGFTVTGITAGTNTPTAKHIPSGQEASLPITVTNPVTAISFATAG